MSSPTQFMALIKTTEPRYTSGAPHKVCSLLIPISDVEESPGTYLPISPTSSKVPPSLYCGWVLSYGIVHDFFYAEQDTVRGRT